MLRVALILIVVLAAAGGGCRKVTPEAAPVTNGAPATLEILKGDRWLFTYVESDGQFSTTDKAEIVPEVSRRLVRVLDPSNPSAKNAGNGQVFVADLNQLLNSGKTRAKALSREAFETGALAQLPAGKSSALAEHQPGAGATPPPLAGHADGGAPLAPGTKPVVTVYGTSWCGACRAARQYLSERKIPFADKDVEQDPAAARELAEKAAKLGIPTDRVPVIEVRGRLLLGFDQARIEALLGEST
ncbi:MAG TPA: glutaredoxin family protein [Polyangia bacterium]|jgi:glutaredoxin|nr:glutaredoxin family protein [Polyangia bacterium]